MNFRRSEKHLLPSTFLEEIDKASFNPAIHDLNAIITKVLDELSSEIQNSHAEIMIVQPLPSVFADAYFLHQLFINIIANALKFKKENAVPRILIYAELVNNFVRILVQDNGIGIPSKHIDKIFIPFFKLGNGGEHPGVGLALCKKIVQRHKGHISAVSSEALGTIIMIDLPVSEEQ
jgi:signal transduction histidine kinase